MVAVYPLTPDRWPDLERLFGPRGACGGCWCMWWRLPRARFRAEKGEGNRAAFERHVRAGSVPGLLAYDGGEPVAWVAVEPRERYPSLERSRNLARIDDAPVWSITCFFVARSHRGRGLMATLVRAALAHARAAGARIVEAYPVDLARPVGDAFVYTGSASVFERLGFDEVARRAPTRPVFRKRLRAATRRAAPRGEGGAR